MQLICVRIVDVLSCVSDNPESTGCPLLPLTNGNLVVGGRGKHTGRNCIMTISRELLVLNVLLFRNRCDITYRMETHQNFFLVIYTFIVAFTPASADVIMTALCEQLLVPARHVSTPHVPRREFNAVAFQPGTYQRLLGEAHSGRG